MTFRRREIVGSEKPELRMIIGILDEANRPQVVHGCLREEVLTLKNRWAGRFGKKQGANNLGNHFIDHTMRPKIISRVEMRTYNIQVIN